MKRTLIIANWKMHLNPNKTNLRFFSSRRARNKFKRGLLFSLRLNGGF
jgi:triosephosphate isomerase